MVDRSPIGAKFTVHGFLSTSCNHGYELLFKVVEPYFRCCDTFCFFFSQHSYIFGRVVHIVADLESIVIQ